MAAILKWQLNPDFCSAPLMVLGTQWYVLFNVIAGAQSIVRAHHDAVRAHVSSKITMWRVLIIPSIAPYLVTGLVSAAGGAWNASVIAEVIDWAGTKHYVSGLGSYIAKCAYEENQFGLALGMFVMSCYVILINRLVWQPLYNYVCKRFGAGS